MVQILPPKTSLGTSLGQALASGLGPGIQTGIQRGMLQNALGANNLIPQELKDFLVATHGIQDQGKVLQAVLPYMQNRMQAQAARGLPSQNQPTLPGGMPSQPSQQLPIQLPQPAQSLGAGFENLGMGVGPIPSTYSEDQYRQVNQAYLNAGIDPSRAIGEMHRQDQIARERFQDIETAAGRQAEFTAQLKAKNPNWSSNDLAVAERVSLLPELRNIKNDALRENAVRKRIELYQAAKDNLIKGSSRRNYDTQEHNRQVKNLSSYAKTLVDAGQRDEAERVLAENAWGPTEIQAILNPLPPETQEGFKKLPKLKGVLEQVKALPDTAQFEKQTAKAFEKRREDLMQYKDFVEKNFKTGTYDVANAVKPGTSLLELRDEAMQRGVTFQEFEAMINTLINEGQIKLDPYQQKEHPLLAEHPARSFGIGEILWRINPFYIPRK